MYNERKEEKLNERQGLTQEWGGASERVEQVRVGARKHFVSTCMENK